MRLQRAKRAPGAIRALHLSLPAMRRVGFPSAFLDVEPGGFCGSEPVGVVFRGIGRCGGVHPFHTFVDDYRQEVFWRRPEEGLLRALASGVCVAPDFTVWPDDPPEWAAYQAWRSALVAGYWLAAGVEVLPVVSFRGGCVRHVRAGSWWAIRGPAVGRDDVWRCGVREWAGSAHAGGLLVFGRQVPGLASELAIPVVGRALVSSKGPCAAQSEGAGDGWS